MEKFFDQFKKWSFWPLLSVMILTTLLYFEIVIVVVSNAFILIPKAKGEPTLNKIIDFTPYFGNISYLYKESENYRIYFWFVVIIGAFLVLNFILHLYHRKVKRIQNEKSTLNVNLDREKFYGVSLDRLNEYDIEILNIDSIGATSCKLYVGKDEIRNSFVVFTLKKDEPNENHKKLIDESGPNQNIQILNKTDDELVIRVLSLPAMNTLGLTNFLSFFKLIVVSFK